MPRGAACMCHRRFIEADCPSEGRLLTSVALLQAPCTLEGTKRQPSMGGADVLFTPPSSPVSGRIASFVPDWEQSLKVCPLRQDCVPFGWPDS